MSAQPTKANNIINALIGIWDQLSFSVTKEGETVRSNISYKDVTTTIDKDPEQKAQVKIDKKKKS